MRLIALLSLFLMGLTSVAAQQRPNDLPAGKRVALVIGNSAYKNTPLLVNPLHDASDMADILKTLGFTVIEGRDLDKAGMDRTIRDFANALTGAKVGLFFYAGHGMQVAGQNYLVPVDAQLTTAAALDFEMVRLDLVHRTMERETATNIIILDACRDNPLARNLARALGTRSTDIGRGLAAVESGEGTLISYSTQPGNVALDGAGRNSPFAEALLKHIGKAGEDLPSILINVRNDVMRTTARRQVPWEHSAMTARFYFREPVPASPAESPSPGQQMEMMYWGTVKDSTNPAVIKSYLEKFPAGTFAPLAHALIEQLERQHQAELAARLEEQKRVEAEQKRLEEARHEAEVNRLQELQKVEQAKRAEERSRAEVGQSSTEAQRLAAQQKLDEKQLTDELRQAQEEAKLARAAARAADEQRTIALKTAEEAKQAADTAKKAAKEVEQKRASDLTKLVALPRAEKPQRSEQSDGAWTINWNGPGCRGVSGSYSRTIRVSSSGSANWTMPSVVDGGLINYSGTFNGSSGSGTFSRADGKCGGTFRARRG